ncbi:DUF4244 domain-containing protein [Kineococcus siccus]|uniref:DUF4244 domain-containing protein n=1 Tax=Kineococcus siccus TaxID=2696567 RepID=UPI00196A3C84|nr:DUF4244 domain-containing protein [Kineococcus siccus]
MLQHNDSAPHPTGGVQEPAPAGPLARTAAREVPDAPVGDLVPAPVVRDAGMATAEYAMATLAACGFAGLLIAILRSTEVRQLLLGVIRQALALG